MDERKILSTQSVLNSYLGAKRLTLRILSRLNAPLLVSDVYYNSKFREREVRWFKSKCFGFSLYTSCCEHSSNTNSEQSECCYTLLTLFLSQDVALTLSVANTQVLLLLMLASNPRFCGLFLRHTEGLRGATNLLYVATRTQLRTEKLVQTSTKHNTTFYTRVASLFALYSLYPIE